MHCFINVLWELYKPGSDKNSSNSYLSVSDVNFKGVLGRHLLPTFYHCSPNRCTLTNVVTYLLNYKHRYKYFEPGSPRKLPLNQCDNCCNKIVKYLELRACASLCQCHFLPSYRDSVDVATGDIMYLLVNVPIALCLYDKITS